MDRAPLFPVGPVGILMEWIAPRVSFLAQDELAFKMASFIFLRQKVHPGSLTLRLYLRVEPTKISQNKDNMYKRLPLLLA